MKGLAHIAQFRWHCFFIYLPNWITYLPEYLIKGPIHTSSPSHSDLYKKNNFQHIFIIIFLIISRCVWKMNLYLSYPRAYLTTLRIVATKVITSSKKENKFYHHLYYLILNLNNFSITYLKFRRLWRFSVRKVRKLIGNRADHTFLSEKLSVICFLDCLSQNYCQLSVLRIRIRNFFCRVHGSGSGTS